MTTLPETFARKGQTVETVAAYVQQYLDAHAEAVWREHLPQIEQIYQRSGNRAYGFYSQTLHRSLAEELRAAGLTCDPGLPGSFPLSREQWGPPQARERRFWCVLRTEQGEELGELVTRFLHDETQLRMPHIVVLPSHQSDPFALAVMIELSALPGLDATYADRKEQAG
ncbi:MAG TPA: DUF6022 family protein [Ktedonobacteraceae bacterium]|jgi:hypothetical protein|nr:DUF6022 family protein [Ktedonobacteraceae bacterium]